MHEPHSLKLITTQSLIPPGQRCEVPAIKHIKSQHESVRLACIEVIRQVGTTKGLATLRGMGSDPDRAVRDTAREAYYELRDKIKEQS